MWATAGAQMGRVSLQAEAEGHPRGGNATYRAEDGDAAWGGGNQSPRGWEGARGGWEGKVSGRTPG